MRMRMCEKKRRDENSVKFVCWKGLEEKRGERAEKTRKGKKGR